MIMNGRDSSGMLLKEYIKSMIRIIILAMIFLVLLMLETRVHAATTREPEGSVPVGKATLSFCQIVTPDAMPFSSK